MLCVHLLECKIVVANIAQLVFFLHFIWVILQAPLLIFAHRVTHQALIQ